MTSSDHLNDALHERYERRFDNHDRLRHFKLVVRADGSFAAKCLETGRFVAGYDAASPGRPREEAARAIYDRKYGEFYTLFLRCTASQLEEHIRQEYERVVRLMPKDHSSAVPSFPENAVSNNVG